MAQIAMGIQVTDVDTTQKMPLGFQVRIPQAQNDASATADQGDQIWTYVFNDEASTAFAAGDVVIRDPSAATQDMYGVIQSPATTHTPAHAVVGVAQHAIAAGSYGFVLSKGRGLISLGTADVTADTALTTGGSAAGSVLDYADDTDGAAIGVIAFSLEAETGTGTLDAYINCLGA